jgi:hypothetical protein
LCTSFRFVTESCPVSLCVFVRRFNGTGAEAGNAALCPIDNSTQLAASFRPLGEYLSNSACQSETTDWVLRFPCVTPYRGTCGCCILHWRRSHTVSVHRSRLSSQKLTSSNAACWYCWLCTHAIMVNLCSTLAFSDSNTSVA